MDDSITEDKVPATAATKKDGKKQRGLGRGLSALFEDEESDFPGGGTPDTQSGSGKRTTLGLDQLEPGSYQPRRHFSKESLAELAQSIATHGVLQPLIVRPKPGFDGIYEIIAGERRWRAAMQAQLHEVPVIIRDLDDLQTLEIGMIENLQREDLNVVEEAQGYRLLMEEFGHTQEKLAESIGKSRSQIANTMRLLTLPSGVLDLIRQGKLSAGHARALVTAANPAELAQIIITEELSVRATEKLAEGAKAPGTRGGGKKAAKGKDVDTIALEQEVSAALGMRVTVDVKGAGAGTLKIEFGNLDQLDDILHRLSHFPGRQQSG